jgi:hypothetical protein
MDAGTDSFDASMVAELGDAATIEDEDAGIDAFEGASVGDAVGSGGAFAMTCVVSRSPWEYGGGEGRAGGDVHVRPGAGGDMLGGGIDGRAIPPLLIAGLSQPD